MFVGNRKRTLDTCSGPTEKDTCNSKKPFRQSPVDPSASLKDFSSTINSSLGSLQQNIQDLFDSLTQKMKDSAEIKRVKALEELKRERKDNDMLRQKVVHLYSLASRQQELTTLTQCLLREQLKITTCRVSRVALYYYVFLFCLVMSY